MFKSFGIFGKVLLAVLATALIYGPIIYFSRKESMECDTVIFIKGESSRDARDIFFMDSGIASIEYCDGSREQIPTHRILRVINK